MQRDKSLFVKIVKVVALFGAPWLVAIAAFGALGVSVYNSTQITSVHVLLNSRLTELLEITRKSSKAEGLKQGREEQLPH